MTQRLTWPDLLLRRSPARMEVTARLCPETEAEREERAQEARAAALAASNVLRCPYTKPARPAFYVAHGRFGPRFTSGLSRAMLDALADSEDALSHYAIAELTGFEVDSVRCNLAKLKKAGVVVEVGRGLYNGRGVSLWGLT